MKKKDFVDALAEKGYTKKDATQVVTDVFETVIEQLAAGNEVFIYGFGTFAVKTTPAHEITAVKNGERILLPEYKTPRFVAGGPLKRAVREGMHRGA